MEYYNVHGELVFAPSAKVLAASECEGQRLMTMELDYHRIVNNEFNTHRAFSRNASSSRAIPAEKTIAEVERVLVEVLEYQHNKRGMQGEPMTIAEEIETARSAWKIARARALDVAKYMHYELNLHKQIINEVLFPYMSITMIVTGTEAAWKDFFSQRCHPSAKPSIRQLAIEARAVYDKAQWEELKPGQWHLPYFSSRHMFAGYSEYEVILSCVGKCARVSYLNHNGEHSIADDLKLAKYLLDQCPPHLSPFEHVACFRPSHKWLMEFDRGNFSGTDFVQVRKMLEYCKRWGGKLEELIGAIV